MLIAVAEKAIRAVSRLNVEYADLRIEKTRITDIRLVNENFEHSTSGIVTGAGVRVLLNGAWGFACSNSIEWRNLNKIIEDAVKMAKATSKKTKQKTVLAPVKPVKNSVKAKFEKPLWNVGIDEKMSLTLKLTSFAKKYSPKIVSVNTTYSDGFGEKILVTSEGSEIYQERSSVSIRVKPTAIEGKKIASCAEVFGAKGGYEVILKEDLEKTIAEKAVKRTLNMLKAKPAPSGRFTVITDQELTGTFAHEAVGHACEADYIVTGESILAGKIGEQIGSEIVTIYDDSTLPDGWGGVKYDDEGVPTRKRELIKDGVLREYILSRETAAKLQFTPNGGSRAQSFSHRPIVRMSDTYLAPKDYTFEELIEDVKVGIYAISSRGGQVDSTKGTFQFNAEEAYLIEKGETTTPLLDLSLSGLTLETLKNIDAIGKDFKLKIGSCGKDGQLVPAGSGGPHIRIKNANVGGRA
jgi:TldD protein